MSLCVPLCGRRPNPPVRARLAQPCLSPRGAFRLWGKWRGLATGGMASAPAGFHSWRAAEYARFYDTKKSRHAIAARTSPAVPGIDLDNGDLRLRRHRWCVCIHHQLTLVARHLIHHQLMLVARDIALRVEGRGSGGASGVSPRWKITKIYEPKHPPRGVLHENQPVQTKRYRPGPPDGNRDLQSL